MNDLIHWDRVWAISRKEFAHVLRDPFTMALAFGLPVLMVVIFGLAIEFNLSHIPTAVLDMDRTPASRALVQEFGASSYFLPQPVFSPREGFDVLEAEKARALVIIPPGFQKDTLSNRIANVQVLIDGADNSAVSSISGYLGEIRNRSMKRLLGVKSQPPVDLKVRFLFNPELNSQWFVVPGLVVVIMAILSVLLTALTVAREWESGSMELLLSTPVRPLEIILGKLAPYGVLGMCGVALVYVLARVGFGVPFQGSHALFIFGSLLFLSTYLAQGLLISVVTRRQQLATQIAMLSGLLPSMLLSGFVFPIDNMPGFFQYFTMLLPARWFMNIARDAFLKGSSFWDLRHSYFALAILSTIFITVAAKKFKKDVEP